MKVKVFKDCTLSDSKSKTLYEIWQMIRANEILIKDTASYRSPHLPAKYLEVLPSYFPHIQLKGEPTNELVAVSLELSGEELEQVLGKVKTSSFVVLGYRGLVEGYVLLIKAANGEDAEVKNGSLISALSSMWKVPMSKISILEKVALSHDYDVFANKLVLVGEYASIPALSESQTKPDVQNLETKVVDGSEDYPLIPDSVYDDLPPFLQRIVGLYKDKREKDMVLLSSLCLLSSCFPSVYGIYDNRIFAPNLFLFITAPASAGKGVINPIRKLGFSIQERFDQDYRKEMASYEQEMEAFKERKDKDNSEMPTCPKRKIFFIPANNSSSKIIDVMSSNEKFGLLFESEADTLVQALKNDWGNFSDTMRKAWHHEAIEFQRKQNNEYISIPNPYLSTVLAGTPNQVSGLFNNVENGFFSRYIYYSFPLTLKRRNVFDIVHNLPEYALKSMSLELCQYMESMGVFENKEADVQFQLNPNDEELFVHWLDNKQKYYFELCGEDFVANVRRMGVISFRLAMILTALRKMQGNSLSKSWTCSSVDFKTATSIADTTIVHAANIYMKMFAGRKGGLSTKQNAIYSFYNELPNSFTTTDYREIASRMEMNPKTAEYQIGKFIKDGKLERISYGTYQKAA